MEQEQKKLCVHCNMRKVWKARGLCGPCYKDKGIKALYKPAWEPSKSHGGRGAAPLPAEPTDAWGGSEEKIKVLAERAERGEQLFHPDDNKQMEKQREKGTKEMHNFAYYFKMFDKEEEERAKAKAKRKTAKEQQQRAKEQRTKERQKRKELQKQARIKIALQLALHREQEKAESQELKELTEV